MARADYFDGVSAARHRVVLAVEGEQLVLRGEGLESSWPLAQVRVAPPLGSIPGTLYLPDGGKCATDDRPFLRLITARQGGQGFFRRVHRWENSLRLALVALVVTVALVAGFIRYGLPLLAEQAAYAIPPATENSLGSETLQILDRAMFGASELDAERRQQLEVLFSGVVGALDASERPYRLELRRSPQVGANAFALPGGTIILTDELVELATSDEEIAAVLAHEVGHVRHRHAMRQVIQSSSVALVIATLTGDVFSASSMAASLPTMLIDADFSRDMEREADDVAAEYLARSGASPEAFIAILNRLEAAHLSKAGDSAPAGGVSDYFASHPPTRERVARLRGEEP